MKKFYIAVSALAIIIMPAAAMAQTVTVGVPSATGMGATDNTIPRIYDLEIANNQLVAEVQALQQKVNAADSQENCVPRISALETRVSNLEASVSVLQKAVMGVLNQIVAFLMK